MLMPAIFSDLLTSRPRTTATPARPSLRCTTLSLTRQPRICSQHDAAAARIRSGRRGVREESGCSRPQSASRALSAGRLYLYKSRIPEPLRIQKELTINPGTLPLIASRRRQLAPPKTGMRRNAFCSARFGWMPPPPALTSSWGRFC